ncbi:uncharacterized protein involved in propionate catabolism (plasmid) [Salipiger abyssi]|uniref:Uncharacterized protein involved in propionate catabolism n=1 Tax=Salipiger abyssi TaxID=1250539 RepID=A0A1P8V1B3_9RHOB|nr:uncharacterized protein involved in propionate catabolism [Salipiger abyssi]
MIPERFPVTQRLAEALTRLRPEDLTAVAEDRARIAFLDTIGVTAAGMAEPPVRHLRRVLGCVEAMPQAPRDRALVLGTAAHALDYDDVAFGGHVSAVIVPALLALLPEIPPADAARLPLAYAAGIEAWAETSSREKTLYNAKGGHPTGLLGPIGAAGAASVLLRLDIVATRSALSMAASLGAGLTVNFGTMTKPLHAGRAAEAGVLAALLARNGMTAAPDGIEAPNGFLQVHSPGGTPDLSMPVALEQSLLRLETVSPSIKCFPVCYAAHRAIDAALALHAMPDCDAAEIAAVEITTSPRHSTTLRYRDPQSVAEARFSLEFAVCRALQTGRLGLADLASNALADPELRALMALCTRHLSDEVDPRLDGYAAHDAVRLHMRDGRVLESPHITRPLGHAENPLGQEDLDSKLADCLSQKTGMPTPAACHGMVNALRDDAPAAYKDLSTLAAALW